MHIWIHMYDVYHVLLKLLTLWPKHETKTMHVCLIDSEIILRF